MRQIVLLVAILLSIGNVNAAVIYLPNPVYLYTLVTDQDVPSPPGLMCKLTIYQDIYMGAPPIVRQGMVCVGTIY